MVSGVSLLGMSHLRRGDGHHRCLSIVRYNDGLLPHRMCRRGKTIITISLLHQAIHYGLLLLGEFSTQKCTVGSSSDRRSPRDLVCLHWLLFRW